MIRHMVALDSKRGIAKQGLQPWKLPTDEQYFREQTKLYGGVVLMGRKTFEVIDSALPGRHNFVLTRDPQFEADGVSAVHDLEAFLAQWPDIWVIGGAELYDQTIKRADELYITEIDQDFDCDTFYPDYDSFGSFSSSAERTENGVSFRFKVFKPRKT